MEKLNELDLLVKEYKKKKDKVTMEKIFKILYPTIVEKAKYVFYEQTFNYRGISFKLVDTKQIDLNDVIQQLSLEIIEWINDFKPEAPFSHYLNTRFEQQHWQPKFMDAEFYKQFKTESIHKTIENNEGEDEINLADNLPTPEEVKIEFEPELTEIEKEVWELMQGNLNISQEEISIELGVSQKSISNIIARIRGKTQK